jgi:hypothetical protein
MGKVSIFTAATGDFPHAAHYVTQLYEGFAKHLGHEFTMYVVTDIPAVKKLHAPRLIPVEPYRKVWGWWNLMELYRPDAPWSDGHVIMTGLDTVIRGDMSWAVRDRPTFLQPFADEQGRKNGFNGTYADGLVCLPPEYHYTDVWEAYMEQVGDAETHQKQRRFAMHPWVTHQIKTLYSNQPDLWQVDVGKKLLCSYREPFRKVIEPEVPLVIFHGSPRPHEAIYEAPWIASHFESPKWDIPLHPAFEDKKGPERKIAVLANGPSLTDEWSEDLSSEYDVTIGVNTAAWLYPVDVWCALDPAVVQLGLEKMKENGVAVPKTLATHENFKHVPEACERMDMPWYNRSSKHLPQGVMQELGIKSCNFTFPNALYVASLLSKGGQVDVYGMDMTPENDVAGKWGDRTGGRWKREFPWVLAAWQKHWRIFGKASPLIRAVLVGEIPYMELVKVFDKYQGGQSHKHPRNLTKAELNARKARKQDLAKKRGQLS